MLRNLLKKLGKRILGDELHYLKTNLQVAECEAALWYDKYKKYQAEADYLREEVEAWKKNVETIRNNTIVLEEEMVNVFLDDERNPKDVYGPSNWLIARNIETVMPLLRKGLVKDLSLDHDLGLEKTGYDLLNWIEEMNLWPRGTIFLHTRNVEGKRRMQQILDNRERSEAIHRRIK